MQVDPVAPELVSGDFVAMLNAAHMCILLHDAESKDILWANPAACELLEFSLVEIRPLKASDMSSSAQQYDRVIGRAWLQEAVERGVSRIEWHYRSRSGRVIPTDALAILVQLEGRVGVMVQFRDIEREQAVERELRLTTSYVDALAHHTAILALMVDGGGVVRFGTDSALRHIGAPLNETLGPLTDYVRLRVGGRPVNWEDVIAEAVPVALVQLEVHGPAARAVWLEGSVERLRESRDGGFLMILHDVSDRVQNEVRRGRELERENYLARYNAMGDMAMAIAHELGQPLAAARNFVAGVQAHASALERPGLDAAPVAEALGFGLASAVRQIERASEIVNSLRAFVGHLEHVEQVVDLNDIVTECGYFIELRADPAGVEVELDLDPKPVLVRCERVLTGQVVLNLAFNAIDEMAACAGSPKPITLSTRRREGRPLEGLFAVADRGRGLLRDPFSEAFTSKQHGSGIGLALSYRIITRQHGAIWSEPRPGGGAIVSFTLPGVGPESTYGNS